MNKHSRDKLTSDIFRARVIGSLASNGERVPDLTARAEWSKGRTYQVFATYFDERRAVRERFAKGADLSVSTLDRWWKEAAAASVSE